MMHATLGVTRRLLPINVLAAAGVALWASLFCATALAQSATDGATPAGMAPGAPAGSYALSGFDNVNLFNGNLNFALPLLKVGGRGRAGYTMTFKHEQKWRVEHVYDEFTNTYYYWTDPDWWSASPGLGAGVMHGRASGAGSHLCGSGPQTPRYYYTYTRLTFTATDGTEYELLDLATKGKPADPGASSPCATTGFSRGRVFVTSDGSAATFISDADIHDPVFIVGEGLLEPSGYLMLGDGTRYRIDEGRVSSVRDRNGNRLTFTYDPDNHSLLSATDSLNRQVSIEYRVTDPQYGFGTRINYSGFGGTPRAIFLSETRLQNALRPGYSILTPQQLFSAAGVNESQTEQFNPLVVNSVWLPDGRRYELRYNSYGELARVVLPTGGAVEYDYAGGLTNGPDSGLITVGSHDHGLTDYQIYRRVTERRIYREGGDANPESTMAVSRRESYGTGGAINTGAYVEVDQRAGGAGGSLLSRTRHYFNGGAAASLHTLPGSFAKWGHGREHQTDAFAADGTTLLRRVTSVWEQRAPVPWWGWWTSKWPSAGGEEPPNDPRLKQTTITLADANQVAKQTFGYDQYNNRTDVWEYDYGAGAPGALVRRTHTDYLTVNPANSKDYASAGPTIESPHLRALPSRQSLYDAAGVEQARVTFEYDNYVAAAGRAPLVDRAGIAGLCTWYDATGQCVNVNPSDGSTPPGYLTRGNLTATTRHLLSNGAVTGSVTTYAQYDVAGNAVKSIDALGREATAQYSSAYQYALPTGTTSPVPDPSGQNGSATALTTTAVYDFSTGLVTSTTDANGQSTTVSYADPDAGVTDPLDRVRKVTRPDGGWTRYDYGVAGCGDFVRTRSKLNAAGMVSDAYQCFDGLGRAYRSVSFDPQDASLPWVTVDTQYDALGRAWRISQPYRSEGAESDINPSERWTETIFDALGRVKTVTTLPDEAVARTDYSGERVLVTDQDGKQRISRTDALGRLTDVWEVRPADAATMAVSFPGRPEVAYGYRTTYTYDALGNLRKVEQGGQARFFMYDSLGRLKRAKNPEQSANPALALADPVTGNGQWSMAYGYDAGGNITSRTDAQGVTTTYTYDPLGRNTTVDYSDTAGVSPDVKRSYDKATRGAGLLWKSEETSATGTLTTVVEYDVMGRPTSQDQQFKTQTGWGAIFNTEREYDLAGNVTSQTYPSGRKVNYTYDATGRLTLFSGRLGDGVLRTYADQFRYDDGGRMEQERFGTATPVFNKSFYNRQGQLAEIRVSTHPITAAGGLRTNYDRGAIINHYSNHCWGVCGGPTDEASDNNGNLRKQDVFIPNGAGSETLRTQFYEYDALNRLDSAREVSGGTTQWQQDYAYDRWGNRTINAANTWEGDPSNQLSRIPEPQFTVDAATNRLGVPPGQTGRMDYNAAGNLTNDSYTGHGSPTGAATRSYDAEGRMTSAQDSSGQASVYTYDADGRRVRRKVGASEVWQVYGMGGELLAEYAANSSHLSPKKEYGYRGGSLLVTAEGPAAPSETNLAHGKSASQSSTYSHSTNPVASKAVDGNTDGNFSAGSMAHTNSEAQAWWRVDLGGVQQVNAVKVWNRSDCCADRLTDFYVLVSDAPFASNDLTATLAQPGVFSYRVTGQGQLPTSVAVGRTGRFVRVQLAGTNYLGLAEVEVLGVTLSEPVQWTSAVGVTASGNTLTKSSTGALAWDAGASSTRAIASGDGYVEFTANETTTNRMAGLSHGDPGQSYDEIDYAFYLYHQNGALYVYENGVNKGQVGTYAAGDRLRVAVEGGQVKYRKNGALLYTTTPPALQYPLSADTSLYHPNATVTDAVIAATNTTDIKWLVSDQLGTPRMIVDQTGSLSGVRRHDYLPFGEELGAGVGGRTQSQGYSESDTVRQGFIGYEHDNETGLDFAEARYFSSPQGRFTSPDPLIASARRQTPQSWNRYSHAINNPLKYVDPSGEGWVKRKNGEIFWDADVNTQKEVSAKYPGAQLFNGQEGVARISGHLGLIPGHTYRFNANGTYEDLSAHTFPVAAPQARISHEYGDRLAWGLMKLYFKAAFIGATGGTGTVAYLFGGASIASEFFVEEDAADPQTMSMAAGTTVYISRGADGVPEYVGITDDFARRSAEHARNGRVVQPIQGLTNLSREDARAVEQVLIERYGFRRDGGSLSNVRNSVSPKRSHYKAALQRGLQILKRIKFR